MIFDGSKFENQSKKAQTLKPKIGPKNPNP